jgi:alkanesulfonate monooxygenase SsuD/methylene tetrahydromethanopterin reductase-like flavin-dependent oxidoreductase (luciferase family)
MQKFEFGVITLQSNPWDVLVDHWKEIEELGFDSVFVADHFVDYGKPKSPWYEGWTLLSGLAAVTNKIKIGTLVTSISLRHPAMLARQALTVDHISDGRLILGIGGGAPSQEGEIVYDMLGLPDWSRKERYEHFKEQIEIIEKLLSEQIVTYSGDYYTLKDAAIFPESIQKPRPTIMIGCVGQKMIKVAVEYADVWNSFGGIDKDAEELYESIQKQVEVANNHCEEIGRDPNTLKRSILTFGPEAWELLDSVENFLNYFEKYSELGFSEFIMYAPFRRNQIPVFKEIAEEIIPNLKG